MQAKVEKLKQSKIKLIITVPPAEMKEHLNHAYSHLAPTVKLDGFRPGKAPRALIESTLGISRILGEGIDLAINQSYQKALEENKINPLTQPNIKINKYPEYGQTEEEIKNDLEFEAEVSVFPEIELGDYSKIKVERSKQEEARKEDVEKIIKNLQKQKATFLEVDRMARLGDLAEVSFEGFIRKVRINAMCSKNHPVVLGERTLIPGFEENIVGMKKGEKKEFKIKFPKDYHAKEHAGADAEFKVELANLKEVKLPEIDIVFVKDFGFDSVEKFREAVQKNLEEEIDKKSKNDLEAKIIDKLLPLVKSAIPEVMIDQEVNRMIGGYEDQLKKMGLNFEAYLKSMNKTADQIRQEMRATAEKNVKVGMMLGKIVEEQGYDHHDPEAGKKAIEYLVSKLTK